MEENRRILIVAGEASGDLHAANLVRAVKAICPRAQFFGLGGRRLKEEGVDLYFDIVGLAVVGFVEVLKNFGQFRRIFKGLLGEIDKTRPDLAILVDYPGFNMRLAQELKKRNIPVLYYVSPQVWAWGQGRIRTIKRLVERMVVVFGFEEELYRRHNVPVSFVGHPLLDIVKVGMPKAELFEKFGLNPEFTTIALLPGSREKEVKTLLPIMLESAEIIRKKIPGVQFLILRAPTVKEEIFRDITSRHQLPLSMLSDMAYDGLAASDFALVASGTATLETAILGIPMAIIYKVSFLTWAYIRMMIKIPYIGLVNVVKQQKFIAEFIQYRAQPKRIADYVTGTLNDPRKISAIKDGLRGVAASLGENQASSKAAHIVVELLNKN